LPAVALGVILNVLDAMSYGIIIFPALDPHIPAGATHAGISMFLTSTIVSQIVYTAGGSAFVGANGSMMIESLDGASDHVILANIMFVYACSTVLTGLVFLLLGWCRLGNMIQFFPRHILVGCIGGIGFFLLLTGIEVTTGVESSVVTHPLQFWADLTAGATRIPVLAASMGLAVTLKTLQRCVAFPFFIPCFYMTVPVLFYLVVLAAGIPLEVLRDHGWLFTVPAETGTFYEFWTWFDLTALRFRAIATCFPTMLALAFFGVLHVPINVPALAVSLKQDVDLNHEIVAHGISNLASGLVGCPQNYLVYSNSLMYIRTGGNSRIGGWILAAATALIWMFGLRLVGYIPILVVGSLIFQLAIELLKESVWDTLGAVIHWSEYLTILIIVATMGAVGFTEGIVIGIVMACFFFLVMYASRPQFKIGRSGQQVRSTVYRLFRQQLYLDRVGHQVQIIQVAGFVFFGTIGQLESRLLSLLDQHGHHDDARDDHPRNNTGNTNNTSGGGVRFVLLDFELLQGIDYSATEAFGRIRRLMAARRVHLGFCNIPPDAGRPLLMSGLIGDAGDADAAGGHDDYIHHFPTLNDALEWCENQLLATYY
ncbi:hypothetical protein CXG81DRAFT_568, partial [Caulochytrium protostelioides]